MYKVVDNLVSMQQSWHPVATPHASHCCWRSAGQSTGQSRAVADGSSALHQLPPPLGCAMAGAGGVPPAMTTCVVRELMALPAADGVIPGGAAPRPAAPAAPCCVAHTALPADT